MNLTDIQMVRFAQLVIWLLPITGQNFGAVGAFRAFERNMNGARDYVMDGHASQELQDLANEVTQ